MNYKVPQLEPYLNKDELNNLKKVIETGWLTEGPFSKEFLEKIQEFTKAKYAVLAPNGTLALYLSLLANNIKTGDEVIVPDFTFNASAASVMFTGAKPVFVDISNSDLNIDSTKIEKALTPKTKAIMPVHVYGQSCDMDPIIEIADKHNLKIIEDAAQGFGVFYKGVHTGTLGDTGIISFFADKTITTGEGAVILTNTKAIYEKLKLLRNQGRPNSGTFIHQKLGMNFRMTDLQCAVGVAQLNKFKEIEKIKLRNYNLYKSFLKDIHQIKFVEENNYSNFVPFRANIRVERLTQLIPYLENKGIQTRRFFYPLHLQPCYSSLNSNANNFPNTNKAYDEGLSLPVFCNLKEEQIKYVCDNIIKFYKKENQ
ncbi:MAG: DegT/DnrJ/EryC1/StrS family aminotransferase [Nanoarchaeota archaeon]|nr:DegT/DnrJ/EryC1/StrS family aminotransferase [Nanoarchaeota archaeon]